MQQLKSDNGSNKGYTTTINDVNSGYNGNNNNYEYGNFNTGGKKYWICWYLSWFFFMILQIFKEILKIIKKQ